MKMANIIITVQPIPRLLMQLQVQNFNMTLLHKIVIWMRQWNVAQAAYEYCEQQDKRNTELQFYLSAIVVVALIVCAMLLVGCATVEPQLPRIIRITEPLTVVELPSEWLAPRRGCYDEVHRIIYVRYETDSPVVWLLKRMGYKFDPVTDCYALGHEARHLPEYDGRFHQ